MLILQDLTYIHPNKDLLLDKINLSINQYQKAALIGQNGVGKSTLIKIMAGLLLPSGGRLFTPSKPYYIPQIFGQFNELTIAQSLNVEGKLKALKEILEGCANEENLSALNDDWNLEERCQQALSAWELSGLDLNQKIETLSGGQKTKVFLAGIAIHQPQIILMDEPSNHLDYASRLLLYHFVQTTRSTLFIVSHDRKLLNLLDSVYELSQRGITVYGGNYDFYTEQKILEANALNQGIKSKEKALRKAKEIERESVERQQKLDARGKKKQEKAGLPTIAMKTLKNNAEKSTARVKDIHAEKVGGIAQELSELKKELSETDKMKFGFDNSALHQGKILVKGKGINFGYGSLALWQTPIDFVVASGDRIAIRGKNGSGKTTLIKIILGQLEPQMGSIQRAKIKSVYIDQDYSLINNTLSVYEQAQKFNATALQEHEIKIRLNRFLFNKDFWLKSCDTLSGGEKMRLMLCCLTIGQHAPDMIILDEPTNNLDIQSIEILTAAINDYQGTLLVISHDVTFLDQIDVKQAIDLE